MVVTGQKAYQILGIEPGTGKSEIKKRYRQLMLQVHPDAGAWLQESYEYSAQEINIAYAVLMKEQSEGHKDIANNRGDHAAKNKKNIAWDAPVNANAFVEREVLHYVEDYDGTVLGSFCVAKGKYLWRTDEDFPLFLRSLYQCSKKLLDEIDDELHRGEAIRKREWFQSELTYLLAQQFIDSTVLLKELAKEEGAGVDGKPAFFITAMLESSGGTASVKAGELLYPFRVRQHRLYLQNQAGKELGYLSFWDDRLYYVIIPLFEQKRVLVKIQVAEKPVAKRRRAGKEYQNLHLWIRLLHTDVNRLPENLNLQIEKLLEEYKERA